MNLCACSKFWVVVPRTSTKAHCYAIDAAPVAGTACTTQWPVQMSNSCQEELASCWKIGTAQFISVRLSSLPSSPCSSQGSSQFPDPEGPDPARPDAVEAVEGCSAFSWAWSFWGRRTWRFWSILGRATSKERAETTPGQDLPELLRSSKTWRVVSSHRWRSLWVFFVVAVLPMVNVWSRWSQCKLRNAASRRILRIVPTTSRSLSLKYFMICVDTSWSIVFYCMLLWYIVIICYFTIDNHAESCRTMPVIGIRQVQVRQAETWHDMLPNQDAATQRHAICVCNLCWSLSRGPSVNKVICLLASEDGLIALQHNKE